MPNPIELQREAEPVISPEESARTHAAVKAEREACAHLAESHFVDILIPSRLGHLVGYGRAIAKVIRERG